MDPSLRLLGRYLESLGLDFRDFQEALDQVEGTVSKRVRGELEGIAQRLIEHERRLRKLEAGARLTPAT